MTRRTTETAPKPETRVQRWTVEIRQIGDGPYKVAVWPAGSVGTRAVTALSYEAALDVIHQALGGAYDDPTP